MVTPRMDHVTVADVEHAVFTVRWLRAGYDETEVDDFLDEVADTLAVHERNVAEVRATCANIIENASLARRSVAMQILGIVGHDTADFAELDEAVA